MYNESGLRSGSGVLDLKLSTTTKRSTAVETTVKVTALEIVVFCSFLLQLWQLSRPSARLAVGAAEISANLQVMKQAPTGLARARSQRP